MQLTATKYNSHPLVKPYFLTKFIFSMMEVKVNIIVIRPKTRDFAEPVFLFETVITVSGHTSLK